MRATLPFVLALLTACHQEDALEKRREDDRAVAMVQAAQHVAPPIAPLVPEAVGALGRCRFTDPARAAGKPILVAGPDHAMIRSDGQIEVLASDTGSTRLVQGFWTRYTGKRHALKLEPVPTRDVPTPAGFSSAPHQTAALTITDANERKVLEAVGDLTCGAARP